VGDNRWDEAVLEPIPDLGDVFDVVKSMAVFAKWFGHFNFHHMLELVDSLDIFMSPHQHEEPDHEENNFNKLKACPSLLFCLDFFWCHSDFSILFDKSGDVALGVANSTKD
jgi:hypothetical protein